MTVKVVWSKPWYRSRGVWGALLGASATIYGLYATALPCGVVQDVHNYAAGALALYGSYLAFMGRRTASQPIHIFWPYQKEVLD